jgi:hypothetical protein
MSLYLHEMNTQVWWMIDVGEKPSGQYLGLICDE